MTPPPSTAPDAPPPDTPLPDEPRPRLRRPEDVLAAVPYVLGFHPADSAVVLGIAGGQLTFAVRADLPPAGEPADALADHLATVVARQGVRAAVLVGYGPARRVEPVLAAVRAALPIDVYDVLRVTEGRYWSYTCANPECCHPAGTPFDVSSSPVAAAATYAGAVALPDRDALVARVAPVSGAARESMRRATARARKRQPRGASAVLAAGVAAVRAAGERYRSGGLLTDDEVAELTVLLRSIPVRDRAWLEITAPEPYVRMWSDVARRAEPDLVAPPASLLAFAAWRAGDGALAAVAVQRALACDPGYSLARLLDDILRTGTPPSILDGWPDLPSTDGCSVLPPADG